MCVAVTMGFEGVARQVRNRRCVQTRAGSACQIDPGGRTSWRIALDWGCVPLALEGHLALGCASAHSSALVPGLEQRDRGASRTLCVLRLLSYSCSKIETMATTVVSSKGQVVIPRHLREKYRLTSGVRLQITETEEGLVLSPVRRTRTSAAQSGWRALRGSAEGTDALRQHLEDHRREARR